MIDDLCDNGCVILFGLALYGVVYPIDILNGKRH